MVWRIKFPQAVFCSVSAIVFNSTAVHSQTVPDSSLGAESSTITRTAIDDNITDLVKGGAIRDSNLFHSFSEFNVGAGEAVYFANPDSITNILTRVTGNNISEIFGTLGVNGAANLWLLNPNGIVFGENAVLDLNGSFFATTAESYVFENEFAYSANNPELPPILTVNIPTGIQFGLKAESIVNRSRVFSEPDFPSGLQVTPESNITLLAGDILLESGHMRASSGHIEVGSVAPNSFVALKASDNNWTLDYGEVSAWNNIQFSQKSSLDVSGNSSGVIQLRGKEIRLLDGSGVFAFNSGDRDSKTIAISATELVELVGGEQEALIQSVAFGEGKGGSIEIETDLLRLADGAQIGTGANGAGDSGNLSVLAEEIEIIGVSENDSPSGLFNSVGDFAPDPAVATGAGGNLRIETDNLYLADRGVIRTGTFGFGNSGDIQIEAQQVLVDSAGIASATLDRGDSGDITVNTRELKVIGEGSQIGTANFGSGQAGNLMIKANDSVEIKGFGLLPTFQTESEQLEIASNGLFASVEPGATGDGGELTVETDRLLVSEGGKIVANTLGMGNAGDITVRANTIEVQDALLDFSGGRSGINSNVEVSGKGNGGDLNIYTNSLEVTKGGSISVDAKGQGNAGNISIEAQEISLSDRSTARVINETEQPALPSQISAFAQGDFTAGSIAIDTNRLNISNGAEISVSNIGRGNSGNLNILAEDLSITNSAKLSAEVNGGEEGNINLITQNLFLSKNASISAKAQGESTGGNISVINDRNLVLLDRSQILANAIQGNGGEIEITTQGYFVSADSLVSASSEFGLDGNVEIETINGDRPIELEQLPENLTNVSQKITRTCNAQDSKLAISGRGGLPENPSQNLRGQSVWQDLRLPLIRAKINPRSSSENSLSNFSNAMLVEADSWQITPQGKVELLTHYSQESNLQRNHQSCSEL